MRLLGIIKKIDWKPRTWQNPTTGDTIYSFRMAFEAEGNQFLGEYTIAPQRLAQLGIRPGVVGYMDIKLSIREFASKTTGEPVTVQDIRFSKWSLANANQPTETPATEQKQQDNPPAVPAAPADPAEQPQEAKTEGSNLPF